MKKGFISLLLLVLFISLVSPSLVHAEESLHVEADIGFENRVKSDSPTVLNMTISNNGEAFSGDLVVDMMASYRTGSAIVVPIDIAAGETKTVPIYLEGYYDDYYYNGTNQSKDIFTFYEGGVEKGKKVKYSGDSYVTPRTVSPFASTILVLTSRQDEISALENLRKATNDDVVTYYTAAKDDPYLVTDVRGLSLIDIIIVDDFAIQDLSSGQQEAIYQWVQQGGTIAFAPTQYAKNGVGIFKDVMPLKLESTQTVVPNETVKQYADIEAIASDILLYDSTIQEKAVPTFQLDSYLFAAANGIGKGQVVQLTYSLYDPVIKNFKGYGQIIKNSLRINTVSNYNYYSNPLIYASDWSYVNELFETFNINIWILLGGIVVYMAIIGPTLYIFLKRKDKREKMWIILPIVAVVTSLLIFIIGAKDRIVSPQIEQMALYEVGDDGTVNGLFMNSLLSNKSGDFTFTMDKNTTTLASVDGNSSNNLHKKTYLKDTADGKTVKLRDVSYWGVQSVVGKTMIEDVGKIEADLILRNKKLVGTIKSTLPVDLTDVKVLSSYNEFEIGTIKAGETIEVSVDVNKQFLASPSINYNYYGYGYSGGKMDLKKEKLNLLKNAAINNTFSKNLPLLVGVSDISLAPIELDGGSKQQVLSYFVKPLVIQVELDNVIEITNEDTMVELIPEYNSWGHIDDMKLNTAYLGEGKMTLVYTLIMNDKVKATNWKELEVKYKDEYYNLTLLNAETGEEIELEKGNALIKENVNQFINGESQIKFYIERIGTDDGNTVPLPTFTLKGEPVK